MAVVQFAKTHDYSVLPEYKTAGAAGFDFTSIEDVVIYAGQTVRVNTGLVCQLEVGDEMQIRTRSSMAMKGIIVSNAPGTIDCDYRGDIYVILANVSDVAQWVNIGDRIAQGVISPAPQATIKEIEANELSKTDRGTGGFGSTGQ